MKDLPTSSAINTNGDLSRTFTRPEHRSPVGEPLGGRNYRATDKPKESYESEGMNSDPLKCALILATRSEARGVEYRIGKFNDMGQLKKGLCASSGSGMTLRPDVVQNCFGGSPVYTDRSKAIMAAETRYPQNLGIKVMDFGLPFPN